MENSIPISKATCDAWNEYFHKYNVFYLHAMEGYGKTTQAKEFAKRYFTVYRLFDASNDGIFECIENLFVHCEKTPKKKLVIINNIQALTNTNSEKRLVELLTTKALENNNTKVMLLSLAPLPKYLFSLKLSKTLVADDKKTLQVKENQMIAFMKNDGSFDELKDSEVKKHACKCLEFCSGYPVAAVFYLQRLAENIYNTQITLSNATCDLHSYFDHVTKSLLPSEFELFLRLSVFDTFTREMAQKIIPKITKKDILPLIEYGFLEISVSNCFCIEPNFHRYLQSKLFITDLFDPKELLEIAGSIYVEKRNMKSALHCYSIAENCEKIEEIVIYLSENADGCEFAEICDEYISKIPKNRDPLNPRLMGAKAMIAAYTLNKKEYNKYLNQLKTLAEDTKDKTVTEVYMRTLLACPISNADSLKQSLILLADYVIQNGVSFKFITPTGNMPSVVNGGLDLLPWANSSKVFQTMMKTVAQTVIGFEAVGVYNTIMGEVYYERGHKTKAIEYLAKGLDEANREGSIRMQYAALAVMARLYCTENDIDKAVELLEQFHKKTQSENYFELLPNIFASVVQLSLLKNDIGFCTAWLEKHAPNEHKKFYLTQRHVLFTKAKVYVALGRELDALFILSMLESYTKIAQRRYFAAQLYILKAVILHRRGEAWEEFLLHAVKTASEYRLVRILADEGAAVLPIFKKINWEKQNFEQDYIEELEKEMKKTALLYPNYLKPLQKHRGLTKKELSVLQLLAQGYKNEQLANELGVSLATVKFHISNIMSKLEVKSRTSIIKIAYEEGIL